MTRSEIISKLCIEKGLLSDGTISQCEKLLCNMCMRKDFDERDIAIAIWLCSDVFPIETIEIWVHDYLKEVNK